MKGKGYSGNGSVRTNRVKTLGLGLTVGVVLLALLLSAAAALLSKGVLPMERLGLWGKLSLAGATLLAAWCTAKRCGKRRLLWSMLTALLLFLLCLGACMLCGAGDLTPAAALGIAAASGCFGGVLGAVSGSRKNNKLYRL